MYNLWGLARVDFFLYLENFSFFFLSTVGLTRVRVPLPRESSKFFSLKNNFSLSRLVELAETSRMVVLLGYLAMVDLSVNLLRALPRAATHFDFLYLEIFSKKVDHRQMP